MGPERERSVVSVVITYNALEETVACLDSLLLSDYDSHRIVVVDNGTTNEAAEIALRYGDRVATIVAHGNHGYGAGANLGIRWALEHGADYVWILNNDTIISPSAIRLLVDAMEADPRIGLASPQITAPEGPEAPGGIWFAGGVVDLSKGDTRHLVTPLDAAAGAVPTEFLTGCALMIRADTIREIGVFWERLFLYWEDTDLNLRAQRAGWKTCVVAGAWIHHAIHGASSRRVVDYYHFRNAVLVVFRHARRVTVLKASAHLSYLVSRRWASALLRRRPAPGAETRGLLAGLVLASRWTVHTPDGIKLEAKATQQPSPGPLRVLHVVRRYAPLLGGTELYVKDLAEAQARQGHHPTVVTLDRDVTGVDAGTFPHLEERGGVRIVRVPGIGSARFGIVARPDILLREIGRADVVHIHDLRFMLGLTCVTARIRRKPVILHTHGLIFHTTWAAGLKRFLVRAYYGPLLHITGAIVASSSEPDRMRLIALAPYLNRGSVVVENAIRLERLLELPRQPRPGRVVAFGRIARSKALHRLVQALATVAHDDWDLVIAGSEEARERARLEEAVAAAGVSPNVTFTGPYTDEELGVLLATASAAAFPSAGEGFGLALLEAMAAGVPVVASNIPAHLSLLGPELADQAADFDDPDAAAAILERLLGADSDVLEDICQRERRRAMAFDISRLARDVEDLYQLLGVGSRPKRA